MTFSLDAFSLDGKVAVVTGAGARRDSIGRAYALGLASVGAAIVVGDLDEAGARAVAEDVIALGGKAIGVGVDITDPVAVGAMARAAQDAFGGVDILVNNAALMVELDFGPILDIRIDDWNRLMAVNVTGALNCVQAIAPLMRARGGGKIVNQVSAGAYPPGSPYGISKLALVGLTTALAQQLGQYNINVNAIAPGATQSEAGQAFAKPEGAFLKKLEQFCPIRTTGAPEELVGALLLLCSAAGDWMTGQVIHVDGGWIIRV